MPSNTTHKIFGESVIKTLPKYISNKIRKSKNVYTVFCQSFDNFFYYNIFSLKKGKCIREFGRYCHKNKTQAYLINIIKYIKDNNLEDDSDCLAYLYGSINHYVLDTTIHPYIFYKTGVFKKGNKEFHKYNSLHTKMEGILDKYFYDLNNNQKKYIYYRHYLNNFPKVKFKNELINAINYVFKITYKKDNIALIYYKSFNQGRLIFKFGVFDRFGIKKFIYKLLDLIRPLKYRKITYVSSYIRNIDKKYLNLNKERWYCSAINDYCDLSIDELYTLSVKKSVFIIKEIDKMLKTKVDIKKLRNIIPNLSYISGLDLSKKYKMHKFEF